jgi:hypothetical protein
MDNMVLEMVLGNMKVTVNLKQAIKAASWLLDGTVRPKLDAAELQAKRPKQMAMKRCMDVLERPLSAIEC